MAENSQPDPVIVSSDDEEEQNDKQIVLYEGAPDPDPIQYTPLVTHSQGSNTIPGLYPPRVLPSVGAFTVQCAMCFKWRLIPSKEKYEEIREHILELPFTCEVAKEWRPEISCEEDGDLEQDDSRLWAIDKPSIAQPPPGWDREVRIRGEGSSKFADVYYTAPSGKKLRSTVEIQKYLLEHPEFIRQGVTLSQFSFQIPKPLQENYVRKRTPRLNASGNTANLGTSSPLELGEVDPISWAPPPDSTPLQLTGPAFSGSHFDDPSVDIPPVEKKARLSTKDMYSSDKLHTPLFTEWRL